MSATIERPREVRNVDAKPTVRQVYAMAHGMVALAGYDWPETRGAASELIQALTLAQSPAAAEEAPF